MPFDPTYQYGTNADAVNHASIAPNGRRVVTADYAILYINGHSVGLVQRFSPSETRPVAPQYEIGNIYPVEFIPQPWSGRIQVGRLEIFKNQLYKAFGFDDYLNQAGDPLGLANYWPDDKKSGGKPIVSTLADIQWPLNMSLHIQNPINAKGITVKNYIECWITEFSTSYDAGAKVVAENVSFTIRNVTFEDVQISDVPGLQGQTHTNV